MSATPAVRVSRRAAQRAATAPQLRVVAAPARSRGFLVYLAACLGLLLGGSGVVLWLNTSLAAGAFDIQELEDSLANYQTIKEATAERLTALSEPAALAAAAAELGMVPQHASGYLVLRDGTVINPPPAVEDEAADQAADGASDDMDDAVQADPASPAEGSEPSTEAE
ncbi:MAG: hypothetical protein LBD90_00350 [Bifidobacteriaceae bacterium]|jgi:hypothetical protein|nr:hypothetical protein [Bifidobacteriaceae bacterium]